MRRILCLAVLLAVPLAVPHVPDAFPYVTLDTNGDVFYAGDMVEINGTVTGADTGDHVGIEMRDSDGRTVMIRTVGTGDDGSFYLKFRIPGSGPQSYDIVASVLQDGGTASAARTVTFVPGPDVTGQDGEPPGTVPGREPPGGGCLVATAAFGSELAVPVQQLREAREALVATDSGAGFVSAFNSIYYSFSPAVADLQRQSPEFNGLVRASITPMLYTLPIMHGADSEYEVLVLGSAALLLNLGMYVAAPAVLASACGARRPIQGALLRTIWSR